MKVYVNVNSYTLLKILIQALPAGNGVVSNTNNGF